MSTDSAVKATVQKIELYGNHGPFAVATTETEGIKGSITFSLDPTVWQDDDWPEAGMVVFLEVLRLKRSGWRAKKGRFWQPSDEQIEQTERSSMPIFLYPISRQYPMDEMCEKIVRELEKRNWQVPGVEVTFDVYGIGREKYRHVRKIEGRDFKLRFSRPQRRLPGGGWNDTAAISDINIPGKEISVYDDESGPTFYLYVGGNWERDRATFMESCKVNSKLNGQPRLYLEYKGGCDCRNSAGASFEGTGLILALMTDDRSALKRMYHTHDHRRPPLLVHNNDLGREYEPEPGEPVGFKTSAVMAEFTGYLKWEVLKNLILSQPVPEQKIDHFIPPASIPFAELAISGELFTFGSYRDAERIRRGKTEPGRLALCDFYGMQGSGWRLVPFDAPNDGSVPEIAYDGFLWCGLASNMIEVPIESLKIPWHSRSDDKFIIAVKPNRANDIYIADMSGRDAYKHEWFKQNPKSDRLTDKAYHEYLRIAGRTIMPVTQYKGGFKDPVVLINRELEFDEVEIVHNLDQARAGGRIL